MYLLRLNVRDGSATSGKRVNKREKRPAFNRRVKEGQPYLIGDSHDGQIDVCACRQLAVVNLNVNVKRVAIHDFIR